MKRATKVPKELREKLSRLTKEVFPRALYKLTIKDGGEIAFVNFEAYLAIEHRDRKEISKDIFDSYFRYPQWDFDIAAYDEGLMSIGGMWRDSYLEYFPEGEGKGSWVHEIEDIVIPYPHGLEFERLAHEMDEAIKAFYLQSAI